MRDPSLAVRFSMSPVIPESFYQTVYFCLQVAGFSPQQLFFISLLWPWKQNYIHHSYQSSSRQMFAKTTILDARSSLVTVIPSISERLPVFLQAEERHFLDPTFGHKLEIATATFMTSCGPWDRKITAVWLHLSVRPTFWTCDRNTLAWQI